MCIICILVLIIKRKENQCNSMKNHRKYKYFSFIFPKDFSGLCSWACPGMWGTSPVWGGWPEAPCSGHRSKEHWGLQLHLLGGLPSSLLQIHSWVGSLEIPETWKSPEFLCDSEPLHVRKSTEVPRQRKDLSFQVCGTLSWLGPSKTCHLSLACQSMAGIKAWGKKKKQTRGKLQDVTRWVSQLHCCRLDMRCLQPN